jgi:hypothetical protein
MIGKMNVFVYLLPDKHASASVEYYLASSITDSSKDPDLKGLVIENQRVLG